MHIGLYTYFEKLSVHVNNKYRDICTQRVVVAYYYSFFSNPEITDMGNVKSLRLIIYSYIMYKKEKKITLRHRLCYNEIIYKNCVSQL